MSFVPFEDALQENNNTSVKNDQVDSEVLDFATIVFVDLFGSGLGSQAKPLFLKNRTLTVSCSSPEIVQGIRDNQSTIVEKINEKLAKPEVDRIRYLV
ncbi:MAG: hypothetical protein COX81_04165 [Candidatus Magasanikbacteria bacterium CG_4_10_14_0_2_um_filter_37_12]|uniref:DUF721 domain-containing protein n=1 Tax=Candidatus Magasanikbacteria bacterium CG_4_10_14_0_2_um_filter_37_12 TaxID=1974637 RepID=A0A2M7V6B9_9BACT|nr:MAG: hypothetical protein COX81_04165 [Candidatus Magasanikbacteria bacterium CG_4_10_14_0_2_um_filter_37_12]